MQGAGVGLQLGAPDVFVHTDAGDLVERAVDDLAVVADPDLDSARQARGVDPCARELCLRGRQRHADAAHTVLLGGVDEQRPPAATDVEQALAALEAQLAADELELALLGSLEGLVRVVEVGARVDHARPQHQSVELVGDVVVMADRGPIAPERVQAARALGLDRGHGRASQDPPPGDPDGGPGQPRALPRREPKCAELTAQAQHGLEIAVALDGKSAGHPRPRQADLVRGVQEVRDGADVADLDHRGVRAD